MSIAPSAVPNAGPVVRADRSIAGFTLVELMLAAALGVLFCGVVWCLSCCLGSFVREGPWLSRC